MNRRNVYASPPAPGLGRDMAAAYCGTCVRLFDQWRAEGKGPLHFRIGSVVRYWPAALDRYLAEHPAIKSRAMMFRKVCPYTFDPHIELVPLPQQLLLPHEVGDRLGVCKRTLNYWRSKGSGPEFIGVGASIRYTGESIRTYLQFEGQQLALKRHGYENEE